MDYLGSFIAFLTAAMTMLLRKQLDPATQGNALLFILFFTPFSFLGLVISLSFQMVSNFQWAVRSFADTENNMVTLKLRRLFKFYLI